ncbi:MAG TPA: hypothetical protein VN108_08995 [Marmoricola sp.]|nr:hypothetical protein [Marmoricola sp.]
MSARREAKGRAWIRIASWAVVALLVGFVAFCGLWRLEGGRWERVETPSMGEVAPVGTLLWLKPVDFKTLRVGDFITFHPPGERTLTYSHRVYRLNADGTISTKGVIPAPDPWRLTSADVIGEVKMNWWGAGWLVIAAPVLIIGAFIVLGIRLVVSHEWKLPVTVLLGSLVITVALVWYRPLINADQLAFAPDQHGGAVATYVGTGLLPIRLTAHGGATGASTRGSSIGASVVMRDGEVGSVRVTNPDTFHQLRVDLKPAIPGWFWVLIVLICFLPALYSLIVGFAPLSEEEPRHREAEAS